MRFLVAILIASSFCISVGWKGEPTYPMTFVNINPYHARLNSKDSLKCVKELEDRRRTEDDSYGYDSLVITLNADSSYKFTRYDSGTLRWEEDTAWRPEMIDLNPITAGRGNDGMTFYHPNRKEREAYTASGKWTATTDTLTLLDCNKITMDTAVSYRDLKFLVKRNKIIEVYCWYDYKEPKKHRGRHPTAYGWGPLVREKQCRQRMEYVLRK